MSSSGRDGKLTSWIASTKRRLSSSRSASTIASLIACIVPQERRYGLRMIPLAEPALRRFLEGCRSTQWFTAKGRTIAGVRVAAEAALSDSGAVRWTLLDVVYGDGGRETYQAPLVLEGGRVRDGLDDPRCARALVDGMRDGRSLPTTAGMLVLAVERGGTAAVGALPGGWGSAWGAAGRLG